MHEVRQRDRPKTQASFESPTCAPGCAGGEEHLEICRAAGQNNAQQPIPKMHTQVSHLAVVQYYNKGGSTGLRSARTKIKTRIDREEDEQRLSPIRPVAYTRPLGERVGRRGGWDVLY